MSDNKTMDTHYDAQSLLWDYACGAADEASMLLAESYLTMCADARRILAGFEKIGGALLDCDCNPSAMEKQSLSRVMDAIDKGLVTFQDCKDTAENCAQKFCDEALPAPVQNCLAQSGQSIKWKFFKPGMSYYPLPLENARYTATLLKVGPGVKTPAHTHHGLEMTLVLQGAFEDETGRYDAGTLIVADDDLDHQPVATKDGTCICLVVTEAPVEFTGRFSGILNFLSR